MRVALTGKDTMLEDHSMRKALERMYQLKVQLPGQGQRDLLEGYKTTQAEGGKSC